MMKNIKIVTLFIFSVFSLLNCQNKKMEEFVKEMGFDSLEEFNRLVATVDINSKEKMKSLNFSDAEPSIIA